MAPDQLCRLARAPLEQAPARLRAAQLAGHADQVAGMGAVAPDHPLVVASRMTFAPADELFLDADVVLAVGTQLSELDWWALEAPFAPAGALLRVDLDPAAMAAGPEPAVALARDLVEDHARHANARIVSGATERDRRGGLRVS